LDQSYDFLENFIYWNSMEKTLLTLNVLLLASFALVANALIGGIPYRVALAVGIWLPAGYNSPWVWGHVLYLFDILQGYTKQVWESFNKFHLQLQERSEQAQADE
jgi:hypothetical protein